MSYAAAITEDRRLSILLLLDASPGGVANEALLQAALAEFGHNPSADQVLADLAWLRDVQVLTTSQLSALTLATITQRGVDVAHGRAVVPGIKKPRPGL